MGSSGTRYNLLRHNLLTTGTTKTEPQTTLHRQKKVQLLQLNRSNSQSITGISTTTQEQEKNHNSIIGTSSLQVQELQSRTRTNYNRQCWISKRKRATTRPKVQSLQRRSKMTDSPQRRQATTASRRRSRCPPPSNKHD